MLGGGHDGRRRRRNCLYLLYTYKKERNPPTNKKDRYRSSCFLSFRLIESDVRDLHQAPYLPAVCVLNKIVGEDQI